MKSLLYALTLSISGFFMFVPASYASGLLPSGGSVNGVLAIPHQVDSYSFTANTGDYVQLWAGSAMQTYLSIYKPDGGLLSHAFNAYTSSALDQTGTYNALIRTRYAGQIGDYQLHFINGSTTLEHGSLPSGGSVSGNLTANDLDSYSFTAIAGDFVQLWAGSVMQTYLSIYKPDGGLLSHAFNAYTSSALDQTGTYRVVIRTRHAFQTGDYQLHFINGSTTLEHGSLPSGGSVSGNLTVNDLDSYLFNAEIGDYVSLSTVGSDVQTYISIYKPDGGLLSHAFNAYTSGALDQAGTYRVVLRTRYAFQTGDYFITFNSTGHATTATLAEACEAEPIGYPTPDLTAWVAFNQTYNETTYDTDNFEYGGEIYRVCSIDGVITYNYTYNKLGATGGNILPLPRTVAGWHTHSHTLLPEMRFFSFPTWNLSFLNPKWITGDLSWVMDNNLDLYLGLPRLGVLKALRAGSTSITQEQTLTLP